MKKEVSGFSSKKEADFLERLGEDIRRVNLSQELKTQLGEDFGLVQFTLEYRFDDEGRLFDPKSGQKTVELTARGGREEETESIEKIERGLREEPGSTWISFSPANYAYDYPSNCVDFWRVVDEGKVVWHRIVVENDFKSMNQIRSLLSGELEADNEKKILASPISSNLKLTELFDLFKLSEARNSCTLELIERVVEDCVDEFEDNFGRKLSENSDLIFRLYSACYKSLLGGYRKEGSEVLNRLDLRDYMYGEIMRAAEVDSFGCATTTVIGEFGSKMGYYISSDGQVKFGEIPDDYKECRKCGCWYKGEKCPFC